MVKRWLDVALDLPNDSRNVLVSCEELPDVAFASYHEDMGWGVYIEGEEKFDLTVKYWRDIPMPPQDKPLHISFRTATEARYMTDVAIERTGEAKVEMEKFYTVRIEILKAITEGRFECSVPVETVTPAVLAELCKCGYVVSEKDNIYTIAWQIED